MSCQLYNLQWAVWAICHYHKITVSLSYFSTENLLAAFLEVLTKANNMLQIAAAVNKEVVVALCCQLCVLLLSVLWYQVLLSWVLWYYKWLLISWRRFFSLNNVNSFQIWICDGAGSIWHHDIKVILMTSALKCVTSIPRWQGDSSLTWDMLSSCDSLHDSLYDSCDIMT